MFVLRKISGEDVQMNIALGSSYTYIGKLENPKEFDRTSKEVFNDLNKEIIYAYVSNHSGAIHPLYEKQSNYIMTEGGKTFANLTKK